MAASGVFANMSRFSLIGNNGLCGGIPELKLPPCQVKTHKQGQKLLLSILLPVAGIATCICMFTVCNLYVQAENDSGQDENCWPRYVGGKVSQSYIP